MKTAGWLFIIVGVFYVPVVIVYGIMGGEAVGIGALTLAVLLGLMVGGYLMLVARKTGTLPDDNPEGLISDSAGELGEFSPYSWWPLPLAACAALMFFGLAVGYWVSLIGAFLGTVALIGWVFEYYRGAHAH